MRTEFVLTSTRSFQLSDFMAIRARQMPFMRMSLPQSILHEFRVYKKYSGCEPLTPDDIAEVIVFTAGRRENVVVADTLIFPNHQVRIHFNLTGCERNQTNKLKASATVLHKTS